MTFRVLVADALAEEGLEILQQNKSVEVDAKVGLKPAELVEILPSYDGLIVRSATQVDAEIIAAGKNLKIIGRAGIGVDNIDVRAATRAGIIVMNTPEGNATTTAEHTLALMFSMARKVPQADASMKAGKWDKKKFMGRELRGLTLGVIGLGNIGRLVAERAQALKMRVVAHDPYFDREAAARAGWEWAELDALLGQADILTVHTPLNNETRGLIDAKAVAKMKKGIMVVNCARGGIYDEKALLAGLEDGTISAAAVDVFASEPPAADDPLVHHPKVICTPHLGASTREAQVQVSIAVAEQMIDYAEHQAVRNAVNLPRLADAGKLAPALELAERIASLATQIQPSAAKRLTVEASGEFAGDAAAALTTAAVVGLLRPAFDRPVNAVNARLLAEERGLVVHESKRSSPERGYASTLTVIVESETEKHTVVGTLLGSGEGRIVAVDDIALEAVPEGHLLVVHNQDRPGVVGRLGTVLGEAGVNISRMHLGLDRRTGLALSIVSVDGTVPPEALEKLAQGDVIWVRRVEL